ncbi:MAG: ATP-dependent RNA helicase HrpA [gamma proteobacterium symbiont of Taylorina sp.]|nr:ATP-dependent RNA helicase HrpA [gamma proteobacterium symbiont of Taylorina sp.]
MLNSLHNQSDKKKYDQLFQQIKHCYLFDQYPIKKELIRSFNLFKKLSDTNHKKNLSMESIEKQISRTFSSCQSRVELSLVKVQQRKKGLPRPEFPQQLPVSKKLLEIQTLMQSHQVIVIAGETGSGKTTQIPKIALTIGRGVMGQIAHTQPRRLAARSVAERIAQELGTPLGEEVGYKVRFNDKSREETYIKLMTDGILLAETQTDRLLNRYDTIIIDEAHERSLNIDFLLGYIKKLLPKRPDLKVIITSATIDTERFSQFFSISGKVAPVIEVSGRNYPVEVRYHPLEEDRTMVDGILAAVDELAMESFTGTAEQSDILVFLSGEREIRETAEALRKHHHSQYGLKSNTEIIPLYARLSASEQNRVFSAHSCQRIVLATNVAETSLTVPGIRYVIDSGVARMSRYSVKHKIQRLPIEKISQASARQRSGRCGRLSDGIAIRLYSEDDHNQRPGFTEPELLRTNLAQVILQMLSLKLGDIKQFPFLEKPSDKQINDGYLLLEQLEAINGQRQLTVIGRSIARLSVDPKLARIILAGEQNNVLSEILVIAAALSCQEPRERPADKQQAADEKHAQYTSNSSDFITYLNLWFSYETQRKHLSQNKLRQYCKAQFISFMRMREWRELYQQLFTQTKELGFRFDSLQYKGREDEEQLDYAAIHQSLLTGFLGNIGFKEDKNNYLGARNLHFSIFPGSKLYRRKPKWIMAAEIIETSGVYARTVARIEPGWLEYNAKHLLKYHYYEPFWEAKSGQVSAWSKVSLYGLVINAKKKVNYGPIDPVAAQEVFVRDALVSGEYQDQNRKIPRFIKYNLALIQELEHLEHKSRRQDLLVDDLAIFEFYQQRLEKQLKSHKNIYSRAAFEPWRKEIERQDAEYLFLQQSDLLKKDIDHVSDELYPPTISSGALQLPLEYHFLPGHALDGVTVVFPLAVINQLDETVFEWLVPGLIREKITGILRALPKTIRKQFVPVPNTVTAFLEQVKYREGDLGEQLLGFLKSQLSFSMGNELERELSGARPSLTDSGYNKEANENVPDHLKMNFKIIDNEGHELDSSRNLSKLRKYWAEQALQLLDDEIDDSIERQDIKSWDFETLPEQVEIKRHGMTIMLYPALQDKSDSHKDSVAIKLFDQQTAARENHIRGVERLLKISLSQELKYLQKQLADFEQACLLFTAYGSCSDLKLDMVDGILINTIQTILQESLLKKKESIITCLAEIRDKQCFEEMRLTVKSSLEKHKLEMAQAALNALQANHQLTKRLKMNIPFSLVNTVADIKQQQDELIYKGFLAQTPLIWLKRLPRYFKGMTNRLEKAQHDYRRDGLNQAQLIPLWERYKKYSQIDNCSNSHVKLLNLIQPELVEYRWLLEEFRISLFAQELKTIQPVSAKRLEKKWQALIQT